MSGEEVGDRDALLSTLAHDLSSPINKMAAFARLLEEELGALPDLPAGVVEDLRYLMVAAEEAQGRLDSLRRWLGAARIGARRELELGALVKEVLDELAEEVQRAEATLSVRALPRVCADADALRALLRELLRNALRHSGPQPRIEVIPCGRGLAICDRGPGIPARAHTKVLQPCVTLDRDRAHRGHGFGLAIARRIAEAHGGSLRLEPRNQGGLRVCLELPEKACAAEPV